MTLFLSQRRRFLHTLAGMAGAAGLAACGGGSGGGGGIGPGGGGTGGVSVTDRRIQVDAKVALHVRDWQPPSGSTGPTIVLLPGLGGNAHDFDSLAPALARRSRVIAVSPRGWGRSDKPVPLKTASEFYEVDNLADDLRALLDALELQRVVLGGHSIAGMTLTCFAGRFPQRLRGLVYLDTSFDYNQQPDMTGEKEPESPLLRDPVPTPEDGRSMDAAIAFARHTSRRWWPALEASLRDSLDLRPDGSVRFNTSDAVREATITGGHHYRPNYTLVRAPALVLATMPGTIQDLYPALPLVLDAKTAQEAADYLRLSRRVRSWDIDHLVAALKTNARPPIVFDNSWHNDFYMAHEAEVVQAIEAMRWD